MMLTAKLWLGLGNLPFWAQANFLRQLNWKSLQLFFFFLGDIDDLIRPTNVPKDRFQDQVTVNF